MDETVGRLANAEVICNKFYCHLGCFCFVCRGNAWVKFYKWIDSGKKVSE